MNNIIFAGTREHTDGERFNKQLEIIVPEKGGRGGRIVCKNFEHSYACGEIVVIPPLLKHTLTDVGANDIHLLIEHTLLPLNAPEILTDVENEGIRHAATQAVEYYHSDYDKRTAVLSALGSLIVSYLTLFRVDSPVVALVRADIEKNFSDPTYSLENTLKKFPLNYDYIRKLFKKEVGVTPHEYLTAKRMDVASDLIAYGIANKYSNYTISQIAEACGFSEPLYFSRVFKKYFGVAPSFYKEP